MTKYLNVILNASFPVAGWFGNEWTIAGGVLLMIGSGWMHYMGEFTGGRSKLSIYADFFGIHMFTLSIIGYLTTPFVMLVGLPLLFIGDEIRNQMLVGYGVLTAIAISMNPWALLVFGVALLIRERWHWLWHPIAAFGYYLLLI